MSGAALLGFLALSLAASSAAATEALPSAGMARWHALYEAERLAASAGLTEAQRARALGDVARLRMRLGDYPGAEADLRAALKLAPGDAELLLALALSLRERPEEALPHAEESARAAASPARAAAAHRLAAELRLDLADADGARASAARALERDADDLEALRILVRAESDRPEIAAAHALRAANAAGRQPLWRRGAAHRFAARLWLELGDEARAEESLRRALDLDADDLDALEILVSARRRRPATGAWRTRPRAEPERERPGDDEELERFTADVAQAPQWQQPDGYRYAARAWAERGQPLRAMRLSWLAADLDRRSIETARLLDRMEPARVKLAAEGKIASGVPQEGAAMLRAAYVRVVEARLALGDADGADAALERVEAMAGSDPQTLFALTRLELERGRPRRALARARALVAADAHAPPATRAADLGLLARIQLMLKDEAGARASLEKALAASPGHPQVSAELERLLRARGEVTASSAAARATPPQTLTAAQRADAHHRTAWARRALKDEAGERAAWRAALEADPQDLEALWMLVEFERARPAEALALLDAHRPSEPGPQAVWRVMRAHSGGPPAPAVREGCFSPLLRARPYRLELSFFDSCLEAFPQDAVLYADRGVARYLAGRVEEGIADLRKALALKPDLEQARKSLDAALAGPKR